MEHSAFPECFSPNMGRAAVAAARARLWEETQCYSVRKVVLRRCLYRSAFLADGRWICLTCRDTVKNIVWYAAPMSRRRSYSPLKLMRLPSPVKIHITWL